MCFVSMQNKSIGFMETLPRSMVSGFVTDLCMTLIILKWLYKVNAFSMYIIEEIIMKYIYGIYASMITIIWPENIEAIHT